jgi:hypothetical protein
MNSVASDAEQRDYLFALWDSLDLGGNVRGSRQRAPLHPGRQPGRDRPGHRAVRPRAPHRLNPAQRRTQTRDKRPGRAITARGVCLTMKEGGNQRGDWIDPDAGRIPFGTCADTWINDHEFKPRTDELYRSLLKNHLKPFDLSKVLASRQGSGSSPRELAIKALTCTGTIRAGDGNRNRMTSLEGVCHRAVRRAELGGSLLARGRG